MDSKLHPYGLVSNAQFLDAGNAEFQNALQTGNFGSLGGLKSPGQVAAMQSANDFANGINTGAAMGSSSGGKYMGRSANRMADEDGDAGGIAPSAPQRPPLGTPINYNPAARDAALRQLASAPTPAPAPAPAARTPGAKASAAGSYQAEWDRLDRQAV